MEVGTVPVTCTLFWRCGGRCELVKYGELVILGYNGGLPQGDKGRRRSKFVLYRRTRPNGVSKSKHYVVKTPQTSQEKRKNSTLSPCSK
jgi:hypothetical protein